MSITEPNLKPTNAIPVPGAEENSPDALVPLYGKSPRLSPTTNDTAVAADGAGVPLRSAWTFWFDRYERKCTAAQYEANLKKIFKVSSIQGFWSVFNNIPNVTEIGLGSYHLMRNDRRPIWEDSGNVAGGYWKLRCPKSQTVDVWENLLLSVIGEQFADNVVEGDDIVGISVSVRDRDDILQIWNNNAGLSAMSTVSQRIKSLTPNIDHSCLFYKAHQAHAAFEGLSRISNRPKKETT